MFKLLFVVSAMLLVALNCGSQEPQKPPGDAAPPAAVKPLPPQALSTPESLVLAKKIYGYDCAMCHGTDGAGKGDLALQMKLTLSDLSNRAALKDNTDAQLFAIIRDGKGQMPAEGNRVKPEGIWNMVAYVRSLSAKKDKAAIAARAER